MQQSTIKLQKKWRALPLLWIMVATNSMGLSLLYPLLIPLFLSSHALFLKSGVTEITRHLQYEIVSSVFPAGMMIGTIFWGWFSDNIGRKQSLMICLLGTLIGYIISSIGLHLASFSVFLAGRVIDGVTAAAIVIALAAAIDLSNHRNKVAMIGGIFAAVSIGFVLGPLLDFHFSATGVFYLITIISFINFLLIFLFPNTAKQAPLQVTDHRIGIKSPILALLGCFILLELGWLNYYQIIALLLNEHLHWSKTNISLYYSLMGLGFIIGFSYLTQKLSKTIQAHTLLKAGLSITALSLIIIVLFPYNWMLWTTCLPMVIANIISFQIFHQLLSDHARSNQQGLIMGLSRSIEAASLLLMSLVSLPILQLSGWDFPLWISIGLVIMSLLTFSYLRHKTVL